MGVVGSLGLIGLGGIVSGDYIMVIHRSRYSSRHVSSAVVVDFEVSVLVCTGGTRRRDTRRSVIGTSSS